MLKWLVDSGIHTTHIDPGKSWQSGTDESFNSAAGRIRVPRDEDSGVHRVVLCTEALTDVVASYPLPERAKSASVGRALVVEQVTSVSHDTAGTIACPNSRR